MLRSCRRCLIVTLFSEQYDSIDLISSKVIISVFIAKVAGQRTCYNMHFVGCLLLMCPCNVIRTTITAAIGDADSNFSCSYLGDVPASGKRSRISVYP